MVGGVCEGFNIIDNSRNFAVKVCDINELYIVEYAVVVVAERFGNVEQLLIVIVEAQQILLDVE